jgi:phosphate transport system permease protein
MAQSRKQYRKRLNRRKSANQRFKYYGLAALCFACAFLVWFFSDLIGKGWSALRQAHVHAEIRYTEESARLTGYRKAVDPEMVDVVSRGELRVIPKKIRENPSLLGTTDTRWVLTKHDIDQYLKGKPYDETEFDREFVDRLVADGKLKMKFNSGFFTRGHSSLPEMAGIGIAIMGTIWVLLITMAVAVPIGVMTSIYLEEFAPDNKLTQGIEVNINNLAAIPSIMFGLLGLAIIINFFGVPRSSALAAGLTLGLMMLPVIIIATRAALRAVPDSIREGAYGVGASPWQVVWHHVLPLSIPGIMTGSIISLARAMGETAPLLIVGLMAFISEKPSSILDGTTVLPAQIYTWTKESERAYEERTAAGILVLLAVLLILNAFAIWFRNRTERRW